MGFYEKRTNSQYYSVVRGYLESLGPRNSILDVGCWDTPVATWGDFRERYTIDTRNRPALMDVKMVVGTWPKDANLFSPVSVVTCLQVLEHITDAVPFAAALFATATEYVMISVPYKWAAGQCKWHVHDPIDEVKLEQMTGRIPESTHITDWPDRRIVAMYRLGATRSQSVEQDDIVGNCMPVV